MRATLPVCAFYSPFPAFDRCLVALPSQDQDRRLAGYGIRSGAPRQQNLSILFHQVLVDRRHFRIFIRLCRRLRHKETDADYQNQGGDLDHSYADHSYPDNSFPREALINSELSFRAQRNCSSFGQVCEVEKPAFGSVGLIILSLAAALIARYPFAAAARSPLSFRSSPPLAESRKCCRTSGPDAAP